MVAILNNSSDWFPLLSDSSPHLLQFVQRDAGVFPSSSAHPKRQSSPADKPATSSQRQPKQRRTRPTIRFSAVEEVKTIVPFPCECHSDLYWSVQDRAGFVERARQEAAQIRNDGNNKQHIHALEDIYQHCSDISVSTLQQHDDRRALLEWVETNGRGLERRVTPVLRSQARTVVKRIVRQHQHLLASESRQQQQHVDGLVFDDTANALGAYSRRKTAASRQFALQIGRGDAVSCLDSSC